MTGRYPCECRPVPDDRSSRKAQNTVNACMATPRSAFDAETGQRAGHADILRETLDDRKPG